MIFLLEYDRKLGRVCSRTRFLDRAKAQRERLTRELELHKAHISREVVLLEAADEEALMRTHERYFKSPQELVESMMQPEPNPA